MEERKRIISGAESPHRWLIGWVFDKFGDLLIPEQMSEIFMADGVKVIHFNENFNFSSMEGVRFFLKMTMKEAWSACVITVSKQMTQSNTHRGLSLPDGSLGRIFLSRVALQWTPPPQAERSCQESPVLLDLFSVGFSGFPPGRWGSLSWIQTPW